MTREEAIGIWLPMVLVAVHESPQCEKAVIMASRALEQESILDEIRAEIEAEPYISKMEVLDIIDKYKAESEEE